VKKVAPAMDLPERNPLDEQIRKGVITGEIEHDDRLEAAAVLNLLGEVDRQAERVMGKGYWCALVFPDEETAQEFLRLTGWDQHAEDNVYVDGLAVAALLGVELHPEAIRFKGRRADKRLVEEVGVHESHDRE